MSICQTTWHSGLTRRRCRYLPVLPAVPGPCSLARPLQPAWVSCHLTASLWPEPALPSTREPAAPVSSSHTDCWEMSCQPSPQPCGGISAQCVTSTGCTVPRGTKLWPSQYSVPDNKPAMAPFPSLSQMSLLSSNRLLNKPPARKSLSHRGLGTVES